MFLIFESFIPISIRHVNQFIGIYYVEDNHEDLGMPLQQYCVMNKKLSKGLVYQIPIINNTFLRNYFVLTSKLVIASLIDRGDSITRIMQSK